MNTSNFCFRKEEFLLAIVGTLLAGSLPAFAAVHVASDGLDSAACGAGGAPPCATILQAVANAGDGDTILVGPGSYAGGTISKSVSLSSAAGTGGAVVVSPVVLAAPGAVFGKAGRGFAMHGAGVTIAADDVTVRGNVITGASVGVTVLGGAGAVVRENTLGDCVTGILVQAGSGAAIRANRIADADMVAIRLDVGSSDAVVRDNRIQGPGALGIRIGGSGHLIRRNLVQGTNSPAFYSDESPADVELLENLATGAGGSGFQFMNGSGWVLEGNAAVANAGPGLLLMNNTPAVLAGNVAIGNAAGIQVGVGDGYVFDSNSAVQNVGPGLILSPTTAVTVSGGNLYGNGANCGLVHGGAGLVTAEQNYWGAPGGPGLDPADAVCGNVASVILSGAAESAAKMKMPPIK